MANNMMNMQKLMKQVQAAQAQAEDAQKNLEKSTFTGTDPAKMVSVTMNGKFKVTGLSIKEEAVDPDDLDMLEDLLIAAFNQASEQIDAAQKSQVDQLTQQFRR